MNTDYFGDIPTLRDLSALIVDMDEGRALAAALGQAPALFLANHGVVFCGASIEEVTCVGKYLERAAWMHLGGWRPGWRRPHLPLRYGRGVMRKS